MRLRFSLWLTSFLTLIGFNYYAYELGWLTYVWGADVSKLSFVNLFLFLVYYLRLGLVLFKEEPQTIYLDKDHKHEDLQSGYEASEWAMAVGMLGTVIGFIAMSYSLAGADFSNIENIKSLFKIATTGMSTALYTTASGIVASLGLRISHYLVGSTRK